MSQIISGFNQTQKNVDKRIIQSRKALYSLLGPCFSSKCLLSATLQLKIFRTFVCPVLRSGLSTFVLTDKHIESLSIYHRKILKGILHVSKQCPSPAIYFALAEAPIEETIHREVFSLFFNIWINPQTKLFKVISYILENICESSKTWCLYLRKLCLQ